MMKQAESFPMLVHAIAQEYHAGSLLVMQEYTKRGPRQLGQSTLWRWVRGLPRMYNYRLVQHLCDCYRLRFEDVWAVIQRDDRRLLNGEAVPLPDVSDIKRGPLSLEARARLQKKRIGSGRGRRRVSLIGAAALLAGSLLSAPASAAPLQTGESVSVAGHDARYRKWRRRGRRATDHQGLRAA